MKHSNFRSVIGQYLLIIFALTCKTPRQCAVLEQGGVIELLTADAVSDFANFCSESSVDVNGEGAIYSGATLQKKMSVLARAVRLAMELLEDGYLDDADKSTTENVALSTRKIGRLRSALNQSLTHVSGYQRLANQEADHRRFNLDDMLRSGHFIKRTTFVAVVRGLCVDTERLFANIREHLASPASAAPAEDLNDWLDHSTTNLLAIVALTCSTARPDDLANIRCESIEKAAFPTGPTAESLPNLADDDTFAYVRMSLSKTGASTQVLFVPKRVVLLLREYHATTRAIVLQRFGYDRYATGTNMTPPSRQVRGKHGTLTANDMRALIDSGELLAAHWCLIDAPLASHSCFFHE